MVLNLKTVKKLLQKEDPVILELGAHKGEDTREFLKEFRNIRIYCFEPDPRPIKQFKKVIKDSRCTLIEVAISNKNGKAILHMSSGFPPIKFLGLSGFYFWIKKKEWDQSSSIKASVSNSKDYSWLIFDKKIMVQTIKLDTWVRENKIHFIDFIWSDIQGAERDMIEGASHTLKIVDYLFMEYGEISTYPEAMTREETIELLGRYNFEIVPEYSSEENVGNVLFKNKNLD